MRVKNCVLLLVLWGIPLFAHAQSVGSTQRLSVSPDGSGGDADSDSLVMSINGRYAVFRSNATNLLSGTTAGESHIYLRDLNAGTTTLKSASVAFDLCPLLGSSDSQPANGPSRNPAISPVAPNGFFALAFESAASNLSKCGDDAGFTDVFLYAPQSQFGPELLEKVTFSLLNGLPQEANGDSSSPSITIVAEPNKGVVAYVSEATNLIQSDTNGERDIFLTTILAPITGQSYSLSDISTIRVSAGPGGADANGASDHPKVSGSGKFVVFESQASNLIEGISPSGIQIYLYSVDSQSISLISKDANGAFGIGDSTNPSISFNGRFIVYQTSATNILPGSSSGDPHIVRFDTQTGISARVNSSSSGEAGNGSSTSNLSATVAGNGRFVAFTDNSSNLVSGDTNGSADVFIKDLDSADIIRVNFGPSGAAANDSSALASLAGASFNATDGVVVFSSIAANLVDGDTEGNSDTFIVPVSSLSKRVLERTSGLEVPADLSLTGKGNALRVAMEDFAGVSLGTKSRNMPSRSSAPSGSRERLVFSYQVLARLDGGRKDDIRRKTAKRNSLTIRELSPGIYSVSYRASIVRKKRTISRTDFSPVQRVLVLE